jgi:hypothetical protein
LSLSRNINLGCWFEREYEKQTYTAPELLVY